MDADSVDEGTAREPDAASVGDAPDAAEDGPSRCSYCGRQFATRPLRALHQGRVHTDELTEAEWAAVVDARETETDRLRKLRIRLLIGLTICYFGLLVLYATV